MQHKPVSDLKKKNLSVQTLISPINNPILMVMFAWSDACFHS